MDHIPFSDPYGLQHPRKDPHFFPPKPRPPGTMAEFIRDLVPQHVKEQGAAVEKLRRLREMEMRAKAGRARKALNIEFEWERDDSQIPAGELISSLNKNPDLFIRPHTSFVEYAKFKDTMITLPPGRYTARTILDIICEHGDLRWAFGETIKDWIELRPRSLEKGNAFSGSGNLIEARPDWEALIELRGQDFATRVSAMTPEEQGKLFEKMVAEQRSKAAQDEDSEMSEPD
jgi:hypothetical protein